jgi:choline dehydrogenase-like flavoprotein
VKIVIGRVNETLKEIAKSHNTSIEQLLSVNSHITSAKAVVKGQKVKIPSPPKRAMIRKRRQQVQTPIGQFIDACPPEKPPLKPLDNWIPLTTLEEMSQKTYDVIIVGSGAGGGAALWRLCEKWKGSGKKVAMLEAGDLLLQSHAQNLPTFNFERLQRYLLNPNYSHPIGLEWDDFSGATQFFALGGRTIHWGAVTPRLQPEDFKDWPINYHNLSPYYTIAEKIMNVNQLYTRDSALQSVLLERLLQGGFIHAENYPMAVDLDITKYGKVHSNVFFSSINFLAYALNKTSFDLAVNASVYEVLQENGTACGVKVVSKNNDHYTIKGKTIILAASTFGTTRILLNSTITSPALGHYLTNHSFVFADVNTNRSQFSEEVGVAGILIPSSINKPFQLQIQGTDPFNYFWYHFEERPIEPILKLAIMGFGIVESRYENRLSLNYSSVDEYGIPKLKATFSYSERDYQVIEQMASSLTSAGKVMNVTMDTKLCLFTPGMDQHEFGTCRMGNNPKTSVTNSIGQVHGIDNLFICDNSVLPSIGAANPTLTTVACSIRTVDYIINRYLT